MTDSKWIIERRPTFGGRWEAVAGPFDTITDAYAWRRVLTVEDRRSCGMLHDFRLSVRIPNEDQ